MAIVRYSSAELSAPTSRVLPAAIPLLHHTINRLTQVRHSMNRDDIDSLARKILATGQLSRGRLVALTPAEAIRYLDEINAIWGSSHQLRSMKQCEIDGTRYYLFVVFGHRRLVACERALEMMAEDGATIALTGNFDGTYLCDIYFGLGAAEAIVMQIGENTYVKPSVRDEMDALWRLWRFMKRQKESLRIAEFARIVGRHPERIKEMLRFTSLPESIQARITPNHPRGTLPFLILLQHARLAEAYELHGRPLTEEELQYGLDGLLLRRVTAEAYRKEVSARIAALAGEQTDLFAGQAHATVSRRQVVGKEVIRAVLADLAYLELVHRLVVEGRIGPTHPLQEMGDASERYSPFSPARLTLRLIELLEVVAPVIAAQLRAESSAMPKLESAAARLPTTESVFRQVVDDSR
ncbi:MAG: hypothetical protein MUF19_03655 [Candidatus Pacebacteria bacterium]|nr:hypothetical protein [Candidatus Paceibacterota bacterium]